MAVKKSPAVTVVNDAEIPVEVLATSIVAISEAMKRLRGGRLADRALFLLIQDACTVRIGLDTLRKVLDAVGELEKRYVRK